MLAYLRMTYNSNTTKNVIKPAIALHNYFRMTESSVYCPPGYIDAEDGVGNILHSEWRCEVNGDSDWDR